MKVEIKADSVAGRKLERLTKFSDQSATALVHEAIELLYMKRREEDLERAGAAQAKTRPEDDGLLVMQGL